MLAVFVFDIYTKGSLPKKQKALLSLGGENMYVKPLDVIVRFNLLGDPSPAAFHYASRILYEKYKISVKTYDTYHYMNMHSVWANATIMYQRNSIMQHVYHKGLFKKTYYLDVVVYPDGRVAFERFKT